VCYLNAIGGVLSQRHRGGYLNAEGVYEFQPRVGFATLGFQEGMFCNTESVGERE
jgi:hypothetical protein